MAPDAGFVLVSCPGSICAKSCDFVEDGFRGGGPYEGTGGLVVVIDEMLDFSRQLFDAGERAAADGLLGNDAEPAFDLVEPGSVSGGVVDMVSGPLCQPRFHFGMFVCGVIIDHEMHIEILGYAGIDVSQEGEKLLMSVASLALGDHFTVGDIERGKQRGGAVTDVVVGDAFDVTESHGQHRLGPVERLHLGLFIDTQDHGVIGRVEIQTHDVAHLLNEEGVIGELEVALSMGLNAEQGEPALHGTFRHPGMLGHRAHAPVGVCRRARLQRRVDHLRDALILETSRPAGPQFLMQALDTELPITLPPLADRGVGQLHPFGARLKS